MDLGPEFRPPYAWAGGGPPLLGEMKDFTLAKPPRAAPPLSFTDMEGRELSLADFKGKLVVINLWATWCAPCIKEMPSLDRMNARLAGQGLALLAISQDKGGAKVVAPFLERLGLKSLPVYLDAKGAVQRALGVRGLPTTVVIDAEGRELGRFEGDANWDGPDARALLTYFLMQTRDTRPPLVKTGG
ncbi:MAG: TlpA disulfide reductase family protein [Rhodospirillales bacterium]